MTADQGPQATTRTVMTVLSEYDVATKRPKEDVAVLLQNIAVTWGNQLEDLRVQHAQLEVSLAESRARVSGLEQRLTTVRRVRLLASLVSLLATTLVGFGVNYLTSDKTTPGWIMLALGVLLGLGSLGFSLVDGGESDSAPTPSAKPGPS